jgi:hypothetical protein
MPSSGLAKCHRFCEGLRWTAAGLRTSVTVVVVDDVVGEVTLEAEGS